MRIRWVAGRWLAEVGSWFKAAAGRGRLEAEMEAELTGHLELLAADLERAGYAAKEARRRARLALGSPAAHKDGMRRSLGLRLWDELGADLRYGARRLRRSVGFTSIAVLSLALAIGANTAIFSLAKQILYERLNVPHPAELRLLAWNASRRHVAVHSIWGENTVLPDGRISSSSFSYPVYEQLRAHNTVMQDLFAFKGMTGSATIAGQAEHVGAELVSGNYFTQLGVRPALGRLIREPDDVSTVEGAVAVIGYGAWERDFGRSAAVLGQVVKLNDVLLTIIGVAPKGFTGAYSTLEAPDLFVPLGMQPLVRPNGQKGSMLISDREWWVDVMGRARPGIPVSKALAALDTQLDGAARATLVMRPGEDLPRVEIRDGSRGLFMQSRSFAQPMQVLLTLVGFVLLLACANIANLMLARGTRRQREISVRFALGAGRVRIARQMLVESILLAILGGVGGTALGYIGSRLAPKLIGYGWQRSDFEVHFDWQVYAFTAGITLATGVLFGLAPALAASRVKVSSGLKESAQSFTRRTNWGGKWLVGFQIALSTLLVVGAGLFLRTLAKLNSVDVGFRTDHLLLVEVSLPPKQYAEGRDYAFHTRILEEIASLPGVEGVSPATAAYIANSFHLSDFRPAGDAPDKDADDAENYNVVGDQFFSMMKIPILAGRSFGPEDTPTSGRVGIVNASLAKQRFGGQNPIGRYFRSDGHEPIQIVGICADTRYSSLRDEPPPQFFLPFSQEARADGNWTGTWTYEIRTKGDPDAILPQLRELVRQQDPDMPLVNVRTQEQQIKAATQTERTFVALTTGFGLLALVLAAVGIYGVMAYSVANRTNEIGIRLALGALPRRVLGMILREGAWISLAGVAVGLGAALGLARLVKSMLYGLQPADPVSLICGAALLMAVGLTASWMPARRAASVEPMEALRHE